jgi:hypothetical protein
LFVFHDGANDDEVKHKKYAVISTSKKNPAGAEKCKTIRAARRRRRRRRIYLYSIIL